MNEDYTLIIPTFNRPFLLKKLISYLSYKGVDFEIIVLDSSDKRIKETNIGLCTNSGLNLRYFDYPTDLHFKHKLLDGLKKVSTGYVSLCADDDIVFPDSLQACVNHLADHTDYVACQGYYIGFSQREDSRFDIRLVYSSPSIEGSSPSERILQLLKKYEALSYAAYRTPVFKRLWEKTLEIDSYLYIELFLALATVTNGKVKRLNSIYYARNSVPPPESISKWEPNYWFAENPEEIFAEYSSYRNSLLEYCAQFDLAVQNDARGRRLLDLMHGVYFAKGFRLGYMLNIINNELNLQQHQSSEALDPFVTPRRKGIEYITNPEELLRRSFTKIVNIVRRKCAYKTVRVRSPEGVVINYKVASTVLAKVSSVELKRTLQDMTLWENISK